MHASSQILVSNAIFYPKRTRQGWKWLNPSLGDGINQTGLQYSVVFRNQEYFFKKCLNYLKLVFKTVSTI